MPLRHNWIDDDHFKPQSRNSNSSSYSRTTTSTDRQGIKTETEYDRSGKVISKKVNGRSVSVNDSSAQQPTQLRTSSPPARQSSSSGSSRMSEAEDAMSKARKRAEDRFNNAADVARPSAGQSSSACRTVSHTDARGNKVVTEFDKAGRMISKTVNGKRVQTGSSAAAPAPAAAPARELALERMSYLELKKLLLASGVDKSEVDAQFGRDALLQLAQQRGIKSNPGQTHEQRRRAAQEQGRKEHEREKKAALARKQRAEQAKRAVEERQAREAQKAQDRRKNEEELQELARAKREKVICCSLRERSVRARFQVRLKQDREVVRGQLQDKSMARSGAAADLESMGFMALKKFLIAHGLSPADADQAFGKDALLALAKERGIGGVIADTSVEAVAVASGIEQSLQILLLDGDKLEDEGTLGEYGLPQSGDSRDRTVFLFNRFCSNLLPQPPARSNQVCKRVLPWL